MQPGTSERPFTLNRRNRHADRRRRLLDGQAGEVSQLNHPGLTRIELFQRRLNHHWPLLQRMPLIAGLLAGCSGIEPWVKPYERDRLADPIMSFDRKGAGSPVRNRVAGLG